MGFANVVKKLHASYAVRETAEGTLGDSTLNESRQRGLTARNATRSWALLARVQLWLREVILPLCLAVARPRTERCYRFCTPNTSKTLTKCGESSRGVQDGQGAGAQERLRHLGLFSQEQKRPQGMLHHLFPQLESPNS